MTKLLEQAIEAARALSPEQQDEVASVLFHLMENGGPVPLTDEQRAGIAISKAQAMRGEFASAERMESIFGRDR